MYTFTPETLSGLNKFRFSSSRSLTLQANIYTIDKTSYEIKQENDEPIDSLDELREELPDNSPRYVIISYLMTTSDGRMKLPYVLVYWIPHTSGQNLRMLYAGATELFRSKAGVSQLITIEEEDQFDDFEEMLN